MPGFAPIGGFAPGLETLGGEAPAPPEEVTHLPPSRGYVVSLRQRAPLRLMVDVAVGQGTSIKHVRWGNDDPNPEMVPSGLQFSTTMPGGFERMSCTLERRSGLDYSDTSQMAEMLTVYGVGGQVAWQGRLDKTPNSGGYEEQQQPEAVGWQAHLEDDNSAREIYIDQDLSRWEQPTLQRKLDLVAANFTVYGPNLSPDPNYTPSLELGWTTPYEVHPSPIAEAWYNAHGLPIGFIYYHWQPGVNINPAWTGFGVGAGLSTDDRGGATDVGPNLFGGPESQQLLKSTAENRTWAFLQMVNVLANSSENVPLEYYWQLAVYGSSLDVPSYGLAVLASDVVASAIKRWAPKMTFSKGAAGTIKPSTFLIPQLAFLEPTTVAEILKQATRFELQDWAVWEGPTFYMNPRGERGKKWRARVGPAQLQQAGQQLARIWNGVVVQYTDVAGQARTVGPPGARCESTANFLLDEDLENPLNKAGIRRWAVLKMGTTTLAGAEQVGAIFLRESKTLETSGQASIVGHAEDEGGVLWPAWMIRAGDTIAFVDAADTSPRRIVHTNWDDSNKTCEVQLDQPPDSLTAILERLSVVLVPLGVS
jgi:hypothetical protein